MLEFLEYQAQRVVDLVEPVLHVLLDVAHGFFKIILAYINLGQVALDLTNVGFQFFDCVPDHLEYPSS